MNSKERRKEKRVWKYTVNKIWEPNGVDYWFEWVDNLKAWCDSNVASGDWKIAEKSTGTRRFAFKNEADAVLFKLKFK